MAVTPTVSGQDDHDGHEVGKGHGVGHVPGQQLWRDGYQRPEQGRGKGVCDVDAAGKPQGDKYIRSLWRIGHTMVELLSLDWY